MKRPTDERSGSGRAGADKRGEKGHPTSKREKEQAEPRGDNPTWEDPERPQGKNDPARHKSSANEKSQIKK